MMGHVSSCHLFEPSSKLKFPGHRMATTNKHNPPSSRPEDWNKGREPGFAFRGLKRGRGGGRGGVSGKGIRGAGKSHNIPWLDATQGLKRASDTLDSKPDSPLSKAELPPLPVVSPSGGSASTQTTASRLSRHRPPDLRSVVITSIPAVENSPPKPNTHTRSSNRHKRTQRQPKARTLPSSLHDSGLRSNRDSRSPASPLEYPRDPPPHLAIASRVSPHDIRRDVDSLVERVRAVAMDHRSTSPGSHLDWAGDEGDSLPDLDDWGEPAQTSKGEEISPIIVEGLKSLPEATSSALSLSSS